MKFPHVNKKSLARKRTSVQTAFSHSTYNLERKNFRRKTTRIFAPFRRYQNHYSNLTSKIMKMCEQILKKRPQYNSNSINCKKPRAPIIAPIASRLLKR